MIKVINLKKSFGSKVIFDNLNIEVKDGELLAIIGKSGSGKSTLLNIMGLLDKNYNGEVIFDNILINNLKENERVSFIRNNINYLFQNYALIDDESVLDNLLLALEYENITKDKKVELINNTLKDVELDRYNDKKIYTLSGGEQQRVALARIMLKRGNYILADEPTGNLDKDNSIKIFNILKDLSLKGKTVIVVTHDLDFANKCDRIISI